MRIGVAWVPCANAQYRAVHPLRAMARRGHEIVLPADTEGRAEFARLASCDVVHVYRRADDETRRVLKALATRGVGVTYDNDDDLTTVPKESPDYKKFGGLTGQRLFAMSVKAARLAHVFTTTTETLAARYRRSGADRIEVIPNSVASDAARPRHPHDGIVIGWVAGVDHRADTARVPIEDALRELIERHPALRVESIGLKLRLPNRYRHDALVDFDALPSRIGGFDIGLAPLADIAVNRARSDIKLKEYAASGVPWLASPIGPYVGLGDAEGGRLVPDDGWLEALDQLAHDAGLRSRLGASGQAWARRHTIDVAAERWERAFSEAASRARGLDPGAPDVTTRPTITVQIPAAMFRRSA